MKTIKDIFSNVIFRIPDYQRGYSWQKSQLEDFWTDIDNLRSGKVHYTGMISVEEVEEEEYLNWSDDLWVIQGRNDKPYFIVDGQQRLTTIIILLWVIIDSLKENEELSFVSKQQLIDKYIYTKNDQKNLKSYIFGYHKDNPSYEYLKRLIFYQDADNNYDFKNLEETSYTNNLNDTKDFFKNKIRNYNLEKKDQLFNKITKQLKFDFRILEKELDIFIVFETMNNRGKPLSNLEKLKNRLIYLSTLLPDEEIVKTKLRNEINESWKTIYKYLGLNKERRLDDDSFLQSHWIVFHRYERREAEFYANDIFDRVFTSQEVLNDKLKYDKISTYINSISKAVQYWFVMFNPHHSHSLEITRSQELLEWLKKQNIVGFKAFQPLIMAGLMADDQTTKKVDLIKNTEAYVFLIFNVSLRRSNTGTYHFNAKANELYTNNITLDDVINDLNYWIYGDYEVTGYFDRDNFYSNLKDLFQRDATNGYGDWKYLKYLLFEYESSRINDFGENPKIRYKDLYISSIAPSNNNKYWKSNFSGYTSRQIKYIKGTLGNYVLSNKNSSQSDLEHFNYVKEHFSNDLINARELSEYDQWNYDSVLERGFKILSFMEKRWNINLGNEQQKRELLFLDFSQ